MRAEQVSLINPERKARTSCMSTFSTITGQVMNAITETLGISGTIHVTIIPKVGTVAEGSEYLYSHEAIIKKDGKWTIDARNLSRFGSELQALRSRTWQATSRPTENDFLQQTQGVVDASKRELSKSGITLTCVSKDPREASTGTEKSKWKSAPKEWGLGETVRWIQCAEWQNAVFVPEWREIRP